MSQYTPWYDEPDPGQAAVALARRLWDADIVRRGQAVVCTLAVATPSVASSVGLPHRRSDTQLRTYAARNACETLEADICGRQRVRVVFLTDGAEWSARRRALRMGRVVEAVLSARHTPCVTGWDVLQAAYRDAIQTHGSGVVRVRDTDQGPTLERCLPHQVLVDYRDAQYGDPSTWVHRYTVDREQLARTYPERAHDIRTCSAAGSDLDWMLPTAAQLMGLSDSRVEVVEAWHLGVDGEPGHYVAALGDGRLLTQSEWTAPRAPFAVVVWDRSPGGLWGSSFTERVLAIESQADDCLFRVIEGTKIRSGRRIFYQDESLNAAELSSNEPETHIAVIAGAAMPVVADAPSLDSGLLTAMQTLLGGVFRWHGVSEMLGAAQRAPGVASAEGQRAVRDLGAQRQAIHTRDWEGFHIDVARLVIDSLRRTASDAGELTLRWAERGSLRSVRWADADLDEQTYTITATAASQLPRELAGRISTVGELYQAGLIPAETYSRLLDMPDLQAEADRANAEYEYLETVIERFLDADLEDVEPGDVYVAPDGYYSAPDARIVQLGQAYFGALRDGAPEANLDLLRRYLTDLQESSARLAAAQAAAAAPPAPPVGAPQPQLPPSAGMGVA